jgi:hypothetical protein
MFTVPNVASEKLNPCELLSVAVDEIYVVMKSGICIAFVDPVKLDPSGVAEGAKTSNVFVVAKIPL